MLRSPTGRHAACRRTTRTSPTTKRRLLTALGRRFLILRNIFKSWLVLVVFALLLGALGWQLGGYRLGILFIASAVLLASAVYWYAHRVIMGLVGAPELGQGETPALHSAVGGVP